jgi:uncharacterized phosphosugar-binding protein
MWILDKQRLEQELRRQGMTLEEMADLARLRATDVLSITSSDGVCRDQVVMACVARALGVQLIDITVASDDLTSPSIRPPSTGRDYHVTRGRPLPDEGG